MSANAKPQPPMSEELRRCVAAAKGLAAKEAAEPALDSLHLLIAAVRLAPHAAQAALESAGYCWEVVKESCPGLNATPAPEAVNTPMPLVKELAQVIYGPGINGTSGRSAPVETEECLALLMQNPSDRLRAFLDTVAGKAANPSKSSGKQDPPPYRSFREYLTDLREVWTLRWQAWNGLQDAFFARIGAASRRQRAGCEVEALIERMLRKDDQTAHRAQASADAAVPTRGIAVKHELSSVQSQILEGLLVYELYVSSEPVHALLAVREFAQLLSPEAYPFNCKGILDTIQGLVKQDLVEPIGLEDISLHSRIRLAPHILSDLLARLASDAVNDDDVAMARRHLSACRSWPL